jgi:hypothetical protein
MDLVKTSWFPLRKLLLCIVRCSVMVVMSVVVADVAGGDSSFRMATARFDMLAPTSLILPCRS